MAGVGATITYTPPPGPDPLHGLLGAIRDGRHKKPVGIAAVRALKDHLVHVEQTDPHRSATALGANPSGLYGDMAQSTVFETNAEGVAVSINHRAARQRIDGGTILPGPGKKYLTIPARREAYGRRAATVGVPLQFGFAPDPNRGGALRRALVAARAPSGGSVTSREPPGAYFWLIRSAEQAGDPTLIPTPDSLFSAMFEALDGWIQEQP